MRSVYCEGSGFLTGARTYSLALVTMAMRSASRASGASSLLEYKYFQYPIRGRWSGAERGGVVIITGLSRFCRLGREAGVTESPKTIIVNYDLSTFSNSIPSINLKTFVPV